MFIGHAAAALIGKASAPRLSLGVLFAAAFGLDLLWPVLLLAGVERVRIEAGGAIFPPLVFESYPWSHSLVMVLAWSALAGGVAALRRSDRAAGVLVGAVLLSHWALDLVVHRPDLPLWPGRSPLLGLGLWNAVPVALALEGGLFAGGIVLYARATRPVDRTGTLAFWGLIVLMTAIWTSQPWSPPPPSPTAVAIGGLAGFLLPIWAGWADRHRRVQQG